MKRTNRSVRAGFLLPRPAPMAQSGDKRYGVRRSGGACTADASMKTKRGKKAPLFANVPARSVLVVLMRDVRATPAEKLALLDELKAAGRLVGHDPIEVQTCEALLQALVRQAADPSPE